MVQPGSRAALVAKTRPEGRAPPASREWKIPPGRDGPALTLRALCIYSRPFQDLMKTVYVLALTAIQFLVGCASDPRFDSDTIYLGGRRVSPRADTEGSVTARRMNFDNVSFWDGDGVSGAPRIRISLGEQKAYFYKGDQLVGVSLLSTGREGYDSPTGNYKIVQKNRDHISSIYGDYVNAQTGEVMVRDVDRRKDPMPKGAKYDGARMPYFMRFVGGVGMHEGFLPGYPASHGCIRMPGFMASAFFNNVEIGTPVTVVH